MNEILEALYNRLIDQISIDYPIYDHVPQDTEAYPYIKLTIPRLDNEDTDTETANSGIIRITGYSRYRGLKEVATMADEVSSALNNWDMANTATYKIGTFKEQFRQFITAPDGLTRNSVQEFIFHYEPI